MILSVENLTKKYNEKIAVDNINISFKKGINGLLGANGAGKTTLMKILVTTLKPTNGNVFFNGENISILEDNYRNILGFLPQDFNGYPELTAKEFIYYMGKLKNLSDKKIEEQTDTLLEMMSLKDQINKKIKTFSGGMRRRLGIAQVLLNDPKIIILDEPTAGLDPKERMKFRNIISTISENRIIILSTHIVSDIENFSTNIIVMNKGTIFIAGTKEEITKSYSGIIWEMNLSEEETFALENFNELGNNYKTSHNGTITFRVISNKQPHPKAYQVEADLESVFLYHGGGVDK